MITAQLLAWAAPVAPWHGIHGSVRRRHDWLLRRAGQPVTGLPVLFLPGHGGSYAQVRSLASETARQLQRARRESERAGDAAAACSAAAQQKRPAGDNASTGDATDGRDEGGDAPQCSWDSAQKADEGTTGNYMDLAWYAADFNEELSAFDGQLLVRSRCSTPFQTLT